MRWRVWGARTQRAQPCLLPPKHSMEPSRCWSRTLGWGTRADPKTHPAVWPRTGGHLGAWGEQTQVRALECTAAFTSHGHKK